MSEPTKITITINGYTHTTECEQFLPNIIEAFGLLLKTAGFCFDGSLIVEEPETTKEEQV